jgi:hypothetical protein
VDTRNATPHRVHVLGRIRSGNCSTVTFGDGQ